MRCLKNSKLLLVSVLTLLSACGGGGGGAPTVPPPIVPVPPVSPPPPPPPADLSGPWFIQSSAPFTLCGRGLWHNGWATVATQTGDQVSFLNSDGTTFSGTVGNIEVMFSGSFLEPASDSGSLFPPGVIGEALVSNDDLTIGVNEETLFGNVDYLWTYLSGSCAGSSQFMLSRTGQAVDTEPNDDPAIPQSLTIMTNDLGLPATSTAAWVMGSVDLVTDEFDVFEIQIGARSRLEVELSHFDTVTADLDVFVIDAALIGIAISDSGDSFEVFRTDLDPGTYYVIVEAFVTSAPSDYILSVDLNLL